MFAVDKIARRKREAYSDDSEDDSGFLVASRSSKKAKEKRDERIDSLVKGMEEVQSTLTNIMAVTKDIRLPLGLKKVLQDSFKCCICCTQTPLRPPVIVTKFCKTVLGCSECANKWFSGPDALTKTCPKCRAERGYNETMVLRGLDTFLEF